MEINVTIEQLQPLVGTASSGRDRTVSFSGWLELLRAIAELAEEMPRPGEPARDTREASQPGQPAQAGEQTTPLQHLPDWSLS